MTTSRLGVEVDATDERSLRTFLHQLETTPGEGIARVDRPVNCEYEAPAVVKRLENRDNRPVWFSHVTGYSMPVVMNLYGSKTRIAMILGLPRDTPHADVLDHFLARLESHVPPVEVGDGPVQEIVVSGDEVDLTSLPIGIHSAHQAGKYINSGVLLVRDPDTHAINAGIYRLMLQDSQRFTAGVDPGHDLGKAIAWGRDHDQPVDFAIVIGADPALFLASQAKVPTSIDAYEVMGSLAGHAVKVVSCKTNDLVVPAAAEIVIEGRISPGQYAPEGPYGEFHYYYGSDPSAVICEVTSLSRRRDAIYADIHPTHMDHRCLWLHPGREASLLRRVRELVPSIRSVHLPLGGAGMVALLSIDKAHNGDPKRALLFALSSDLFIKHAVIVDSDVDVTDAGRVAWALATRFQGEPDLLVARGVRGFIDDPTAYGVGPEDEARGLTTKIGYDATAPLGIGFPEPADILPEEYRSLEPLEYLVNP